MSQDLVQLTPEMRMGLLVALKDRDGETRNALQEGEYRIRGSVHIDGVLEIRKDYTQQRTTKPDALTLLTFVLQQLDDSARNKLIVTFQKKFGKTNKVDPVCEAHAEELIKRFSTNKTHECRGVCTGHFEVTDISKMLVDIHAQ